MDKHDQVASVERVLVAFDDAWARKDLDGVVALYAPDATLESPLIPRLLGKQDGICRGRDEIRELVRVVLERNTTWGEHEPPLIRGTTAVVKYKRTSKDGEQNDYVDVIEVVDGAIRNLRAYWGWLALQKLGRATGGDGRSRSLPPRRAVAELRAGVNRVTFASDGEILVGNLYLPAHYRAGIKLPALVVGGSLTSVKEQMAGLYACRMAEHGFAALAFDYRNFGESTGQPRQYASPEQHIADIRSAVTFLQGQPAVDRDRIGGLGVCTSGAYMGVAVAREPRIKAYAGVVPHIGSAEASRALYGGEAGVRERREAGRRAKTRYRETGEVEYILAYSNKVGDPTASHTGPMEYYFDASRGYILPWTNKFAVMSWEDWLDFAPITEAHGIRVPTLIIHGDNAALPANARAFFEKISAREKRLIWRSEPHFDFYDREASKIAADEVAAHFRTVLELTAEPPAALRTHAAESNRGPTGPRSHG